MLPHTGPVPNRHLDGSRKLHPCWAERQMEARTGSRASFRLGRVPRAYVDGVGNRAEVGLRLAYISMRPLANSVT